MMITQVHTKLKNITTLIQFGASMEEAADCKSQADVDAVHNKRNSQTKLAGEAAVNFFAVCIPPKDEASPTGTDDVDSSQVTTRSGNVHVR